MNIRKVIVTGSNGFVGKHLLCLLTRSGVHVAEKGRYIDVVNKNHLNSVGNVEAIVHLAAKTSILGSIQDPYETYYTNIIGTLNLLEFARLRNVKFIYISSYVYGQPHYLPVDEGHPVNPHSPYNRSKLLAEQLCKSYSQDFKMDVVTLRPFYLYGPDSNSGSFIQSVVQQINANGRVVLSGENTKRDFLFISDFTRLVGIILNQFPSGYSLYNVGYGTSCSLEEVTKTISKLLKKKTIITYDRGKRPGDVTDMKADISKVSRVFNWKPTVPLTEGLRKTLEI